MIKTDKLGWIVAAGLAGIMIGGGFQGGQVKIGVVDFGKILDQNVHSKASTAMLTKIRDDREALLKFMDANRAASAVQLTALKTLSIKDKRTPAEEAELTKLRTDIEKTQRNYETLVLKQNLTGDEQAVLRDLSSQRQNNETTLRAMLDELGREVDAKVASQGQLVTEKARAAVEEVAKAGGYSVIFDMRSAPYGSSDVTEPALKALNAKQ